MNSIVLMLAIYAAEPLPIEVAKYLAATDEEARIPVFDLNDKPNLKLVYGSFGKTLEVGDAGLVHKLRVLQIVDEVTMRADVYWIRPLKHKIVGPGGAEFHQFGELKQENVMIRKLSTRGMVDDASYEISVVFRAP